MRTLECELLVVGSGPSGAVTATLLAEAGHDVLLAEEGPDLSSDSAENYSYAEMDTKYRHGGLTTTFGGTNVTYIEGRCVGGASEINAALYHRPHDETLERWARDYRIDGFGSQALEPRFSAIEQDMQTGPRRDGLSPASQRLMKGAEKLGWTHGEIERFWRYRDDDGERGRRQSMSNTLIPRARAAGCRLEAHLRIKKLIFRGDRCVAVEAKSGRTEAVRISFKEIFLCCGAVQTPTLLRRSGITRHVGDSLRLHPMVRIAARFDEVVNDPDFGVPVRQVDQFKPELTLGCSHSSIPHIALWLGQAVQNKREVLQDWNKVAVFYAAVCGEGTGTIRALPLVDQPFVRYELTKKDYGLLAEGLMRMGELVLAAGAKEIFSPFEGQPSLRGRSDLSAFQQVSSKSAINVTTIHLFSSCPMGELDTCPVDSWGRLKGAENVHVHDASLLPTSPGVNPQGTIMAIARRNTEHYLGG